MADNASVVNDLSALLISGRVVSQRPDDACDETARAHRPTAQKTELPLTAWVFVASSSRSGGISKRSRCYWPRWPRAHPASILPPVWSRRRVVMSCTWPPLAVLTMPGADCGAAGELRAESPSPLKSLRVCQHLLRRSLLAGTTSQRGLLVSARPDQRIPSPGNPAGVGPTGSNCGTPRPVNVAFGSPFPLSGDVESRRSPSRLGGTGRLSICRARSRRRDSWPPRSNRVAMSSVMKTRQRSG
jgi:hypothetical protein